MSEYTPDTSVTGQGESTPDYQAQLNHHEERSREATARSLADRNDNFLDTGGSDNFAGEQQLLQIQQQISSGTLNPIQLEAAQRQAEALAAQLVSGQAPAPEAPQESPDNELVGQIRDKFTDWDESVAYAAQHLSETTVVGLNEALSGGDPVAVNAAAQMVDHFRKSEGAGYASGEYSPLGDAQVRQLNETYGSEITDQITTLGAAVASGHVSIGEAIATASRDQTLLRALLQSQQKGILNLYLGR